jgi:hypothetical protein
VQVVDVSGNEALTGALPEDWAAINTLTYIDASDNTGLTGTMPVAWSQVRYEGGKGRG